MQAREAFDALVAQDVGRPDTARTFVAADATEGRRRG
jgi:hypothetical protein